MKPLEGIRRLSLATNIPSPVAVARLLGLGASGLKIKPPVGDPLAAAFAAPLQFGLTGPGGLLAGSIPGYNLYPAQEGWVAVRVS